LSHENSALALFDDKIPIQTKTLMVKALNDENNESNIKKIIVPNNFKNFIEKTIDNLLIRIQYTF